jgi:hypothetical protein
VKFIVFRQYRYSLFTFQTVSHALLASLGDLSIYVITLGALLGYLSSLRRLSWNDGLILFRRFYLTLLFPEFFKTAIIILYIFDSTSNLLFLLNFIIISLQFKGIECILEVDKLIPFPEATKPGNNSSSGPSPKAMKKRLLLTYFGIAIMSRIVINFSFYSLKEILILGGIVI